MHIFKNISSIPAGYETQLDMMPLDFIEFLWAIGFTDSQLHALDQYTDGKTKIPDVIHTSMLSHLREYMIVGGMPDVVNTYVESKDIYSVHRVQEKILRDYQDDIAKYAEGSVRIKARSCFLSIPRQLSKENHKFQYSVVEKKGTARKI